MGRTPHLDSLPSTAVIRRDIPVAAAQRPTRRLPQAWHDGRVHSWRSRCAAIMIGAAVLTSGCVASPDVAAPSVQTDPAAQKEPAVQVELVQVELVQLRGDVASGHIELRVTNETDAPLTVVRATYDSSQWAAPMVHADAAEIPPGLRRNLRLLLPDATCDPGTISQLATLEFDVGTVVERVPGDPLGQLESLDDSVCNLRAFEETVAELTWLEPSIPADGAGAAVLRLRVAPAARRSGTLDAVDATVLLTPVDASGTRIEQLPVGLAIAPGDAPTVVEIPLEPGRCDLHAIAEDKQGTIFRLRASIGGEAIDLLLVSPEEQRNALLDWAVERCAAQP